MYWSTANQRERVPFISVSDRFNQGSKRRVSMQIYCLILISNANARCILPVASTMKLAAAAKHTNYLGSVAPSQRTFSFLYSPMGEANLVCSSRTPSYVVFKSPSNPALQQHTQTNRHSTGGHKACSATAHPRCASRHKQARSAAAAAGRPASDYPERRVRKAQKGRTVRVELGMKARLVLTARHLANKQRMCRWLLIGGCEMRWESRRRMWPTLAGCWDLSLVRTCSVVAGGLVVGVVSLV